MAEPVLDPVESTKRLEMHVKRISSVKVTEEPTPDMARSNLASPDVQHIGSMIGEEEGFGTTGSQQPHEIQVSVVEMRRRVLEAPLGPKIGYHELDDEKEDADEEWMTGEASQLSGAGTRGSNNWVLKVMLPICLIVGIICLHNWWSDVKKHASTAIGAVGDVFDRRALLEAEEEARQERGAGQGLGQTREGREGVMAGEGARQQQQAVYSVNLGDGGANAENENTQA